MVVQRTKTIKRHSMLSIGLVKNGDIIVIAGFGAGLAWGSAIIKWGG